jgi:hypothetical protein
LEGNDDGFDEGINRLMRGGAEKNYENSLSVYPITWTRFESSISMVSHSKVFIVCNRHE